MDRRIFTTLVLLALGLWAVVGAAAQNKEALDATYDPAKNETTVYLSKRHMLVATYPSEQAGRAPGGVTITSPEGLSMTVLFKTPGNAPSVPESLTIRFRSIASGGFRFDQNRVFSARANAVTMDLGMLTLVKSVRETSSRGMDDAYYQELLEGSISLDVYERVIQAKKVEFTVGTTKFRIPDKELKILRSYVERLKS